MESQVPEGKGSEVGRVWSPLELAEVKTPRRIGSIWRAKGAFRRMMWRVSAFLGVEVLNYVVMDNHFHILVKVPERAKWLARFEGEEGERSLLKHLATLYSKKFICAVGAGAWGVSGAGK
ncbi:MAG: hypothetical protein ACJAQT_002418 [Akkermansiaceae bacterium]|jgi:hypothetical protein